MQNYHSVCQNEIGARWLTLDSLREGLTIRADTYRSIATRKDKIFSPWSIPPSFLNQSERPGYR